MRKNMVRLVQVTDLTHTERQVVCDISSMGPLLAGWWSELGLSTATMSTHARAIIDSARRGDWASVHARADHVSLDVSPVRVVGNVELFTASDRWAL